MHPFLFNISYTLGFFFTFLSSTLYKDNMLMMLWWLTFFFLPLLVQVSDFPYFTDCVVFFSRTDPYVLQEQLIKDGAYYIVTPEGTVTWDEEWESGVIFSNVFTSYCINLNHICFIYFCVSHVSLAWAKFKIGIHDKE